jgi:RNA polymerase sigma factor (TIGR02999 family)
MRLVDQSRVEWQNRAQFLGIASQMMRRILVDHARGKHAARRGGGVANVPFEDAFGQVEVDHDLVKIHEALDDLAKVDPSGAKVIELRYFGGLSIEETAQVMGTSASTVKREWAAARTWLYRELSREGT